LTSFDAVVGLIDQQPKITGYLPVANIILLQRFACWSKDQHGLEIFTIHHSPFTIHHSPLTSFDAVVGLLTNNRSLQDTYPLLKLYYFNASHVGQKTNMGLNCEWAIVNGQL
jgi:hypothetical protein